ncbi:MAG: TetR family transcriptional regulator C-terminal domain-containing protein, partial [Pseudomonadota bacterium]
FADDQLGASIKQNSAEQSLNNYIEIYLKEATVREGRMRALYIIMGEALGAVPEIQESITQLNQGVRGVLATIIQKGIESGEFSADTNPELSAVLIHGMLRGVVMQYLSDRKTIDIKKILPLVQSSAMKGLR